MTVPERMSKIRIITSHLNSYKVIDSLYDSNILHIKKYNGETDGLDSGKPLKQAENFSRVLLTLRAIKNELGLMTHINLGKVMSFNEKNICRYVCIFSGFY